MHASLIVGVDKLDNFEQLFVDFLKATCEGEGENADLLNGRARIRTSGSHAAHL